jgi:cysteinyl-tRNA synthetase
MDKTLGLGLEEVVGKAISIPDEIRELAEQRVAARALKDWKRSDELRDQIKEKGWQVEDHEDGTFSLSPGT